MKVFIIVAVALFATVGADEEPTAIRDHPEGFHHHQRELFEKLKGLSDEERTQEIEKAVEEYKVMLDELHEKFMAASVEERKEMEDTFIAHMPLKFRKMMSAMTEEERDAMIVKRFEKYGAMNTEERKTHIEEMFQEALKKMERKPLVESKNHHEGSHHYYHELSEKLNAMSDEERAQEIKKAVEERLEKFNELQEKFMAASVEERKEMEATIMAHTPPYFREMLKKLTEEERSSMMIKKIEEYGAMDTEERKTLITEMIQESLKTMKEKPVEGHHDGFHRYHHELFEKLKGMSDEDRTQEIEKAVEEHLVKFNELHEKFMAATPEERKEMETVIIAHMPPKFRGMLAVMTENDRDAMLVKKFEEYGAMNTEERKALITEMVNEALDKMEHKPHVEFKDIPENKRLHMREKFESLSPEERQKLHDKLFRKRFHQFDEDRPHLTEEQKQKIQEILETFTLEQLDEIRRQMHTRPIGPRQPLIPTPADGENVIQEIRRPQDDILIGDAWTDDEPRQPRL